MKPSKFKRVLCAANLICLLPMAAAFAGGADKSKPEPPVEPALAQVFANHFDDKTMAGDMTVKDPDKIFGDVKSFSIDGNNLLVNVSVTRYEQNFNAIRSEMLYNPYKPVYTGQLRITAAELGMAGYSVHAGGGQKVTIHSGGAAISPENLRSVVKAAFLAKCAALEKQRKNASVVRHKYIDL